MSKFYDSRELKTLALYTSSGADREKMFWKQRMELERQAEFARRYRAQRGSAEELRLDPVLRVHLRLDE